jgi:hypothetical protein
MVHENFLIEPPFKTLLSKTESEETWYGHYFPQISSNKITLFKCLHVDTRNRFFEIMVKSSFLGIDELTKKYTMHTLPCSHYEVLKPEPIKIIADKINKAILKV